MYIAFKWLICMGFVMWLCLCIGDSYSKNKNSLPGIYVSRHKPSSRNITQIQLHNEYNARVINKLQENSQRENFIFYNLMFFAGACVVMIYHKKNNIIICIRKNLLKFYIEAKKSINNIRINVIFTSIFVSILKYFKFAWNLCCKVFIEIKKQSLMYEKLAHEPEKLNVALIIKLKALEEQRKSLGRLLFEAIQENKNIRLKYQLETMAKNRLAQHVENSQNELKKNRFQYVSFQQLYLVTHQENIFLKSRISKITKEKEMAERNLLGLINQVCLSNNRELKAYCSRIIVNTKNNLLNSDVRAEIKEFLKKSRRSTFLISNSRISEGDKESDSTSYQNAKIEEILETDVELVALVKDAPKLRGLPGEYVWTVKDKNGIIEKLYECAYETDLESNDTIRRIREYSVYYDKDCILDSNRSLSDLMATNEWRRDYNINCNLKNQHFLTGSQAFQNFLQNNKNLLQNSKPKPFLLDARF